MREKKLTLYPCPSAEHNVRVTYLNTMDPWKRRAIHQKVIHCSYKTDSLCKVELYPSDCESKCPAVLLANRQQFK